MDAPGQKRAWKTPQLTVLVRIDMSESVLQACKSDVRTGASNQLNQCRNLNWQGACVGNCNAQLTS